MEQSNSIRSILGILFIFFSLTPWTHWGLNSMDSQPWPLLFGSLYLVAAKPLSTNSDIIRLSVVVAIVLAILLALQWPGEAPAFRALASYLTLIVCSAAYYDYLQNNRPPMKLIYGVNILWLVIGVLQLYLPQIASVISESRTSEGRGVTSMAPEPTFFAVYLIFSTWLILLSKNYRHSIVSSLSIILNIISIIFLCKSSMGLLFLIFSGFIVTMYQFLKIKISSALILLSIIMFGLITANIDFIFSIFGTRMAGVLEFTKDGGIMALLYRDESINLRMEHLVFSFDGLIRNFLLPGGFDTFLSIRNEQLNYYNGFFWSPESTDKIMSFYGAIAYELGIFGIAVIGIMIRAISRGKTLLSYSELLIFSLFALAAIPVAFAPLHLVLAALIHKNRPLNKRKMRQPI